MGSFVECLPYYDNFVTLDEEVTDEWGMPVLHISGELKHNEKVMMQKMAEAAGYPYYVTGLNVKLKKGMYGNTTLSKFTITQSRNINLTVGKRKARGCQHSSIQSNNSSEFSQNSEVFNLHLGLSAQERIRQIGLLTQSEEFSSLNPDTPCLVGGDFNDWRSMLRALFIIGKDFQCATDRTTLRGNETALKTFPSFAPRGGLDRIYYRGKMTCHHISTTKMNLAKVASDHLPVLGLFEVEK